MIIHIDKTVQQMGLHAAQCVAKRLNQAISNNGEARLLLSTGASQFEVLESLTQTDVDFSKVTMFHLDEYVGLPIHHIASFRKYLQERFVSKLNLKETVFVSGEGDVKQSIALLTDRLKQQPIDVGVIGIGENGHIAFNDPPADFDTEVSYKIVDLDERCKLQQVREGWFENIDAVPKQAISMSVRQIMASKCIISVVPHRVKAEAVKNTLFSPISPNVPATILKTHPDWELFLDQESASGFCSL